MSVVMPLKATLAAVVPWPTPTEALAQVTALNSAIKAYVTNPSDANYASYVTARNTYITTLEGIPGATLTVTGNDTPDPATTPFNVTGGHAALVEIDPSSPGATLTANLFNTPIIRLSGTNSALALNSPNGPNIIISNNSVPAVNDSPTINNSTGATFVGIGLDFQANHSGPVAAGGAYLNNGAVGILENSEFTSNTTVLGGAIGNSGPSYLAIRNATFTSNQGENAGGVIYSDSGAITTIVGSTFNMNTSAQGGAIFIASSSGQMTIESSTFTQNKAGSSGGAINDRSTISMTITDSNFIQNTAGTSGGAIFLAVSGASLNLNVSDNVSTQFSGNAANGQASSLAFVGNNTLNVDVGTGGVLQMEDPMSSVGNAGTITITKSGDGVWRLGGNNNFAQTGSGNTQFTLNSGSLYLYDTGEVSGVTAGNIALNGSSSTFSVLSPATLVAGGTNTISTAGTIEVAGLIRGGTGSDRSDGHTGITSSLTLTAPVGVTVDAGGLNVGAVDATDTFTLIADLMGTGSVSKMGNGTVILQGTNTYTGGTVVDAGILRAGTAGAFPNNTPYTLNGGTLDLNNFALTMSSLSGAAGTTVALGSALLTVDQASDQTFAGQINGTGGLTKQGSGTLTLAGNNTYTGTTNVNGGILSIAGPSGSIGTSNVQVNAGGTLTGTDNATIGNAVTINANGHLVGTQGQTLAMHSLVFESGSFLDVTLGDPSTMALFSVNGDLTLGGTLNVNPDLGFGPGVYRLIDYAGTLTNNGMQTEPGLSINVATAGQVNLINTQGDSFNFWDGSNTVANNQIDGGNGTWNLNPAHTNWTNANGTTNAPYDVNHGIAIFTSTLIPPPNPSIVTIDNSFGQVTTVGMQFAIDGYRIEGGSLALAFAPDTSIRVGNGTLAGAAITATIA
jgi:autotransporter-associated beta strand protein/predicted outer membrane repeat protein